MDRHLCGILRRISKLRQMSNEMNANIDIEVDGGINKANVTNVIKAGANIIVSGTSVFKDDIEKNIKDFQEIFKGGKRL